MKMIFKQKQILITGRETLDIPNSMASFLFPEHKLRCMPASLMSSASLDVSLERRPAIVSTPRSCFLIIRKHCKARPCRSGCCSSVPSIQAAAIFMFARSVSEACPVAMQVANRVTTSENWAGMDWTFTRRAGFTMVWQKWDCISVEWRSFTLIHAACTNCWSLPLSAASIFSWNFQSTEYSLLFRISLSASATSSFEANNLEWRSFP